MADITKKSGQLAKKLSRFSKKAGEKSKEHIKTNFLGRFAHVIEARLLIIEWLLLVTAITFFAIIQSTWYTSAYQTTAYVTGGSYSEGTLGEVKSLNPLFATTDSEKTASRLLFATLIGIDQSGSIENQLARSISHDDSGKVWTLTLRENLLWSDGAPIVADDILYTFSVIKSTSARTTFGSSFSNIKIEKVDDLSVTFTLPTIFADFPSTLTVPLIPSHILSEVTPALLAEHSFSLNPVTSGPFVFDYIQHSATSSQTIVLSRNPHYYRGTTMLSRFSIVTYADASDLPLALETRSITATASISDHDEFPTQIPYIYQKNSSLNRGAFAFLNNDSPILSNVSVRRAVRRAIDLPTIRKDLGIHLSLDYPILQSQADLTFPSLPEPSATTALETLLGSGFTQVAGKLTTEDDNPAELTIATIDTGYLAAFAERIAEDLTTLGFTVTLHVLPSDESQIFFTSIVQPRAYDILLYEIDMGSSPDLLAFYHSTQANENGYNFSNYKSTLSSDLILAARSTFDTDLRRSKYESFLRHWVDEVPAIGLYQAELSYFYNRATRTFSENSALVAPRDRFSDVLYWASEKSTRLRTP